MDNIMNDIDKLRLLIDKYKTVLNDIDNDNELNVFDIITITLVIMEMQQQNDRIELHNKIEQQYKNTVLRDNFYKRFYKLPCKYCIGNKYNNGNSVIEIVNIEIINNNKYLIIRNGCKDLYYIMSIMIECFPYFLKYGNYKGV